MRKLRLLRPRTPYPVSSADLLFVISRFFIKYPPKEDYDPPFSPVSRPPKPPQNKKKTQKPSIGKKEPPSPLVSDLPFNFRYSYSETNPSVDPIGFRESPKFSPFGPNRLASKWTGTSAPSQVPANSDRVQEKRNRILGDPLYDEEVAELVEKYRHSHCSRQINLGIGGVTHNTLNDIHNHWRRATLRVVLPKDKSGGKIIYRHINILLLYRGRNYSSKTRPVIPLMLWKPYAPIYPKLVMTVVDGLSFEETKELRNRGLNSPSIMKLSEYN